MDRNSKGFSFVEMMVVLAIIGIFLTFSARKLVNPNSEMKSAVRRFTATVKKLRNRARIENKTYRLVFDLPPEKEKEQSYWVESTAKAALLLNEEQRETLEEGLEEDEQKQKPDPQGFIPDASIIKDPPATLPRGLFFDYIELANEDVESIKSGRVYIYFFPQGYVQGSAIHLTDRQNLNWTLAIQSLTGQVDIYNNKRDLKEILSQ